LKVKVGLLHEKCSITEQKEQDVNQWASSLCVFDFVATGSRRGDQKFIFKKYLN